MERPLISFVTPMREQDFRVIGLLHSIRQQNYPQEKIEIVIVDDGSAPAVLERCKEYGVKIVFNKEGRAEGKGRGKDIGIWESCGKYVVIAEADISLIGKEWINRMIAPLEESPVLFASVPKLYVKKEDHIVNRYLSYVGVDPFAAFRSLEGQLAFGRVPLEDKGSYYQVKLNPFAPYCMGSNGFMFRRELIDKVGDYAQDVEFIARLVKNGFLYFAIPKGAFVFHANVKSFRDFLKKRWRWTRDYTRFYAKEKKDFVWVTDKTNFFTYVAKNLLVFPNLFLSLKNWYKDRDQAWLLHPFFLFISTSINIWFGLMAPETVPAIFKRKDVLQT